MKENQIKLQTFTRFDKLLIPALDIDSYAGQIDNFHIFIETCSNSSVPSKDYQMKILKWIIDDLKSPALLVLSYFSNDLLGSIIDLSKTEVCEVHSNIEIPKTLSLINDLNNDRTVNNVLECWLKEANN